VSCKEVNFLRVAVFFDLEVILGQAADDVPAPISHYDIDIDQATGYAKLPGVRQALRRRRTPRGEEQSSVSNRERQKVTKHRSSTPFRLPRL
jgi:hypothetical protein